MQNRITTGLWRLADPKISITSLAAMLVGGSTAARVAPVDWTWHGVMFIALFCMEVAKNAWGEVYDYDSGTDLAVQPADRTGFSGGKRVMVDQLLTRQQTWMVALLFGAVGVGLGAVIVFLREPSLFVLGVLGLVLGWSYHGRPLQLVYRGLGELDVVLCYGPLIVIATFMVQTGSPGMEALMLSLPLGILIAAFLWVNEFPDHDADVSAGKRNLVVMLGKHRASRLLPLIYAIAALLLVLTPLVTTLSTWILLGFIYLPFAGLAAWWVWQEPLDFYRRHPVQPLALLAFVTYAMGVAAGALLA